MNKKKIFFLMECIISINMYNDFFIDDRDYDQNPYSPDDEWDFESQIQTGQGFNFGDSINDVAEGFSKIYSEPVKFVYGKGLKLAGKGLTMAGGRFDLYEKAKDLVFQIPSRTSNAIFGAFDKNPNAQPIEVGEKHMILPTKYGYSRANYAGPGTKLEKRLKRGDKGVDGPGGIDEAAQQHDIDYSNATTVQDVRKADDEFLDKVRNSGQSFAAKASVISAMKAKRFAENVKILDPMKFTGKGKKFLPGQWLKKDILKHPEKYFDDVINPLSNHAVRYGGKTYKQLQKLNLI